MGLWDRKEIATKRKLPGHQSTIWSSGHSLPDSSANEKVAVVAVGSFQEKI